MKTLQSGGFTIVILQEANRGELRVVKKIYTGTGLDFSRGLSVMIKVADMCIGLPNGCYQANTTK